MSKLVLTGNALGDFLCGVGCFTAVQFVWNVVKFLSVPCLKKVQNQATIRIPQAGDDLHLTIWGLDDVSVLHSRGILDTSPFVVRVECYLKLLGKDYVKRKTVGFQENPRHMVPFANVYGTMVDDSSRIVSHINQHFNVHPDDGLTPTQVATGHLIQRLLTESLYFSSLCLTFATDSGRAVVAKSLAKNLSAVCLFLFQPMIFRHQLDRLQGQGIAKFTTDEVCQKCKDDIMSLAVILGDKHYILGTDHPTWYDTDVYAFVGTMITNPNHAALDWVKDIKKEHPLFVQYIGRMHFLLLPEQKLKTA